MVYRENTVLMLGAGSSSHCGFPLGKELLKLIKEDRKTKFNHSGDYNRLVDYTLRHGTWYSLLEAHDPPTVDAFLYMNRDNGELVDGVRKLIIRQLLKLENRDAVLSRERAGNWYHTLFDYIGQGQDKRGLAEGQLLLKIITFNYDLSLDYFLYRKLKGIFHQDEGLLNVVLSRFSQNIIHVYGQLDSFQWQGGTRNNEEYGKYSELSDNSGKNEFLEDSINKLYNNITSVGLPYHNNIVAQAKRWLREAKYIYFFGFGFDRQNVDLLDIKNTTARAEKIYATTYRLNGSQNETLEYAIKERASAVQYDEPISFLPRGDTLVLGNMSITEALNGSFPLLH